MQHPSSRVAGEAARRIVILTTVHRPFDVRIFHKQARGLAQAGYDVALIARTPRAEVIDGVRMIALPEPRNRLDRGLRLAARALRVALAQRADVYHLHDPELIWVGLALKLCGKRVVYDVHEELALMRDRAYVPALARGVLTAGLWAFERLAETAFDAIVAATPLIAEHFRAGRTVTVRNTPRASELAIAEARPYGERPMRVAYVGGLAAYHNVAGMIDAMRQLPAELGARLSLGGDFRDPAAEARARGQPGAERVDFEGWADRPKVISILGDARVGLVVYLPTENVLRSDPIKFLEMMAAGLPLVATDIPRWRELVSRYDCGLLVDARDPGAIAAALETLLRDPARAEAMGRRGREAVLRDHEWAADEARLLALYDRLLAPRRRGRAAAPSPAPA
ncbi:glycosyltransferase family 4 protein [Caulobacter sp. KR2-114]|uniref:glycosyltransferase family 4 protein n=1 Tax=Caulobacter sp. KR2-114 TaxID=3400912 RepID=UPI003C0CBC92